MIDSIFYVNNFLISVLFILFIYRFCCCRSA